MANRTRIQPTAQGAPRRAEPEVNPFDTIEVFYETHKQRINTITSVVLIVVLGYFGYTRLVKGPNEEKAATALSYPQLYFQADSLNLALNGDGQHLGFSKIAKKYDGTSAGNLAHYYEGLCYLKMNDFNNAIKSLNDFNGKGTILAYEAWGSLGDAYMESGNQAKAIEFYKKAAGNKDDIVITPMYLFRLGLACEMGGKPEDAKSAFERIRDEYPKSLQARDIDRELAKLGVLN